MAAAGAILLNPLGGDDFQFPSLPSVSVPGSSGGSKISESKPSSASDAAREAIVAAQKERLAAKRAAIEAKQAEAAARKTSPTRAQVVKKPDEVEDTYEKLFTKASEAKADAEKLEKELAQKEREAQLAAKKAAADAKAAAKAEARLASLRVGLEKAELEALKKGDVELDEQLTEKEVSAVEEVNLLKKAAKEDAAKEAKLAEEIYETESAAKKAEAEVGIDQLSSQGWTVTSHSLFLLLGQGR